MKPNYKSFFKETVFFSFRNMDLAGQYGSIKHESTANGMNTVIVVILALMMISFIVLTVIFVAKVPIIQKKIS